MLKLRTGNHKTLRYRSLSESNAFNEWILSNRNWWDVDIHVRYFGCNSPQQVKGDKSQNLNVMFIKLWRYLFASIIDLRIRRWYLHSIFSWLRINGWPLAVMLIGGTLLRAVTVAISYFCINILPISVFLETFRASPKALTFSNLVFS